MNLQDIKARANVAASEAKQAIDIVGRVKLRKRADLQFAVGVTAEIKEQLRGLTALKKEAAAPLKEQIKEIGELFKPSIDVYADAEERLKEQISSFAIHCDARRHEILESISSAPLEEREGLIEEADELEIEKVPGLSLSEKTDVSIEDPAAFIAWAASNNRLDLLAPNEKAIKREKVPGAFPGVSANKTKAVAITVSKVER